MKKEHQISLLVSGFILLTGAFVARHFVLSYFESKEVPACGVVASSVLQLNLKAESGQLMTPIQLQTEFGTSSPGIIDNARVVDVSDGPPDVAIEVRLPEGASSPNQIEEPVGGVAFTWEPIGLSQASTACLRYAIKLPADFKPGDGGVLPGLFGGSQLPIKERSDGTNGFTIQTLWRKDGELELYAQIPNNKISNTAILRRDRFEMPLGKWVWFDQQITLNTASKNDGVYRLWIDGKVVYQADNIVWRTDDLLSIRGVSGAIHYGTATNETAVAPTTALVGLSPFQLSWQ